MDRIYCALCKAKMRADYDYHCPNHFCANTRKISLRTMDLQIRYRLKFIDSVTQQWQTQREVAEMNYDLEQSTAKMLADKIQNNDFKKAQIIQDYNRGAIDVEVMNMFLRDVHRETNSYKIQLYESEMYLTIPHHPDIEGLQENIQYFLKNTRLAPEKQRTLLDQMIDRVECLDDLKTFCFVYVHK